MCSEGNFVRVYYATQVSISGFSCVSLFLITVYAS